MTRNGSPPTRATMVLSAGLLFVVGVGMLFAPTEVAAMLGQPRDGAALLALAGAGYLGLAALDWLGRTAIYGGVFGRPIVVCNFAAGFISASVLAKLPAGEPSVLRWVLVACFALHALAFARLLFFAPPWQPVTEPAQPQ